MWFTRSLAPATPGADRRYRKARYVSAGRCENATFLLNKKTGRYYKLDDTGSELWTLLGNPTGVDRQEILRGLGALYDVAPPELAADVDSLIATLVGYDVIEIS